MSSAAPLAIAQITPYPLEAGHPVTAHALRLAQELAERGHRLVVLAPSRDPERVRRTRAALREDPAGLLPEPGAAPVVLAVGEALPPIPGTTTPATLPVDAARAVEDALTALALDIVHVHEPFGPSVSSIALRHSRTLNVGTFHLPAERFIATQVTRKRAARLLGRLDDRQAASATTAALVARSFPIGLGYVDRVPPPAAASDPPEAAARRDPDAPLHLVVPFDEERPARRAALRALRRLDLDLPWRATVVVADGDAPTAPLKPALRDRIRFLPIDELRAEPHGEHDGVRLLPPDADVVLLASTGARPAPHALVAALHVGAVPVASRIGVHDELTDGGARGLLFEPGDVDVLVAQLERLLGDPQLAEQLRAAGREWVADRSWAAHVDWVLERYAVVRARRHDPERFDPEIVARLRDRPRIDVDLHMHTDHSGDCATPAEVLLDAARRQGLGAIVITDHNEVSGAFEALEKADRFGVKVIVGEEVKTADQGEVIGIFLKERIPKGVTLQEAIAEIRRQGGLVYVPHPFDRMHSVPDYEHLLDVVGEIDAIEIFNPRVAIGSFNEEAAIFAEKYRIVAGAGSDSHVAAGLGSVRVRIPDFDGPEEFLVALSMAEIETKPGTLVYVQALKFLETKATPPGARRRVRARRVRRATRD
ncbi:PHP domain-containing protein [Patulibacter defluvii]|uniref:PHP domain-containing protein n=1 Tax=Patulibacter defluvii TaxID=3095358 RepID=UPI002A74CECE|nr:PHP domain-containing protein [Patulibacter sp. DM4]